MTIFVAIAAGLLTAYLLFHLLFKDKDDLLHCIKYWFIPDEISWFRGEFWTDWHAENKLFIWLAVSIYIGWQVNQWLQ